MSTTARAWQFEGIGGPELLRVVDRELAPPDAGEALVRIRAIGLNRADLLYMAGRYFGPPPSPSYLGQEAVGEIVEIGPPVEGGQPVGGLDLRVGDRVGLLVGRVDYRAIGTYRTAGVYPQNALLPLPESLSFAEGAGFWLVTLTAIGGLRAGGLTADSQSGKRVLVTAASSGVGVMTLQIARAMGAETFAVTTSPTKAGRLETLADHAIVAESAEVLVDEVKRLTDGRGVDLAFDPIGFDYARALMETAAVDGQVVVYGLLSGTEAPLDYRTMIFKDLGLHGYTVHRLLRDPDLLEASVSTALSLAEDGAVRPVIAAEYGFDEAPDALAKMARNEHVGKIVLTVESSKQPAADCRLLTADCSPLSSYLLHLDAGRHRLQHQENQSREKQWNRHEGRERHVPAEPSDGVGDHQRPQRQPEIHCEGTGESHPCGADSSGEVLGEEGELDRRRAIEKHRHESEDDDD
jgi:NADPH:quinone reductase-like Zn-dependent oxidoreductase